MRSTGSSNELANVLTDGPRLTAHFHGLPIGYYATICDCKITKNVQSVCDTASVLFSGVYLQVAESETGCVASEPKELN